MSKKEDKTLSTSSGQALRQAQGGAKPAGKSAKASIAPSGSPMDVNLLQQIVQLMTSNDLNTVDLRDGARRVILKRGPAAATVQYAAPMAAPAPSAGAPTPAPTAKTEVDADAGLIAIKSPMVGTFYSKPSPDSKAFVAVGTAVSEETTVCVIEAMKAFNPVAAEVRGTITKILVQDGSAVAFDTPLFLVKPA